MKRARKVTLDEKKRHKLTKQYLTGGGDSQYARKRDYCRKNGVWGWEVPFPKPWSAKKVTAE
ncbi:MAG: hypothetical protein U9Q07_04125 [Planctomycetota bacterium]|nr:hypothetical protein [Planctomycetota bacterium]